MTSGDVTEEKNVYEENDAERNYVSSLYTKAKDTWMLTSLDTTFYEADSITGYTTYYGYDEFDNWRLLEKDYVSKTMDFKQANSIPVPPSDFRIEALLNLSKTAASEDLVSYKLTWKDNSNNEDGFKIYQKVADSEDTPALIATVGVNETTYTDYLLDASTVYEYSVIAFNEMDNNTGETKLSLPSTARTDVTVDVKDEMLFSQISVAPNPVVSGSQIKIMGDVEGFEFNITDTKGQILSSGIVQNNSIQNEFSKGLYFLKLSNNNNVKVCKFEVK